MNFGQDFICATCKKEPSGDYHIHNCAMTGIDLVFYTCKGECNAKFRSEYIEPFKDEFKDDSIDNRFEILDL
jgi:hypothetical protein